MSVNTIPGVEEVILALRDRFHWLDYLMLALMLLICLLIGLYYGFYKVSNTTQEYLMGGKKMKLLPISASLVASFISGISMLGIPTETYLYGNSYMYLLLGLLIFTIIFITLFLPVFYNLHLTSIYEYLEKRFDRKVRVFGSFLFTLYLAIWLSIVIYMPALAFNQVTGVNVHILTPIICIICIFYTSLGGLQAVVYTDFIQSGLMIGSILLVSIKGTLDIGGFGIVWDRNMASGRIMPPNFDLSLFTRYTLWSSTIGIAVEYLHGGALNQTVIQRLFALPTLKQAKKAIWLNFVGIGLIILISAYSGLLIYATFHKCDPLTTKLAKQKDQLMPLLVMKVLGNYPGLAGIFIAGILSASLSSLSTGLNSMAAIVVQDFYTFLFDKELSERRAFFIMRGAVLIFGAMCVAFVYVFENLGSIMQLYMIASSVGAGATTGLFVMGVLCPWITAKGALTGACTAVTLMIVVSVKAQEALASGAIFYPHKPLVANECDYHFVPNDFGARNETEASEEAPFWALHHVSFLWYNFMGATIAVVVGFIVSFATKANDPRDVDVALLAPFYKRIIKPREYPNEPNDGIIFAYEKNSIDLVNVPKDK